MVRELALNDSVYIVDDVSLYIVKHLMCDMPCGKRLYNVVHPIFSGNI